ncbi:MAG: VOC family protein, partial [Candidatus Binatia bacterium]
MAFRIRRVGHLVLRVKDRERSKRFFEDILGFPVVAE